MVSDSSGTGRLAGKVAIVSGGARGIGEATTRAFVREGAQVVIGDLLDAEGEALVAELGPVTRYCHLDVRVESDWQRIVAQTTKAFGAVDVLVNNAGVMVVCPLEASTKEMFERTFQVNVLGPFLGTQSVIEPMRRAGGGSIVTVSSVSGHTGTMGLTAYSASKAGNAAITKCAAMELGPDRIRVNAVVPGGIETPMSQGPEFEGIDTSSTYLRLPIPRIGQPEEVAEAVLFLASDASSYMTGTEVIIDGGMLAGPLLHWVRRAKYGQAADPGRVHTVIVGGDEAAVRACWPLLGAFGQNLFHVGPAGAGNAGKLANRQTGKPANNLFSLGGNILQIEAMHLAAAYGISEDDATRFISVSSGDSRGIRTWGGLDRARRTHNLAGTPAIYDLQSKDVQHAAIAAGERGVTLPVAAGIGAMMSDKLRQRDHDLERGGRLEDRPRCSVCDQELAGPYGASGAHPECR